jgi:hypothetical protein
MGDSADKPQGQVEPEAEKLETAEDETEVIENV